MVMAQNIAVSDGPILLLQFCLSQWKMKCGNRSYILFKATIPCVFYAYIKKVNVL